MGIKQKVSNSASVTDFQYKEGRNSENSAAIAADKNYEIESKWKFQKERQQYVISDKIRIK